MIHDLWLMTNTEKTPFYDNLQEKMDEFVHAVYMHSKKFPKEELYGLTSQLRRSSLSVVLNFIEGYARIRSKVQINFYEISYGSLQEAKYLVDFSFKENLITKEIYNDLTDKADEIGAMLWGILRRMKRNDNDLI